MSVLELAHWFLGGLWRMLVATVFYVAVPVAVTVAGGTAFSALCEYSGGWIHGLFGLIVGTVLLLGTVLGMHALDIRFLFITRLQNLFSPAADQGHAPPATRSSCASRRME